MKKAIKIILIISIFLPLAIVHANGNLVVKFEQEPLFNEANFLPGEGVTRWVKVTNEITESGRPQRIAAEAVNYSGFVSGSPRPHSVPDNDLSRALAFIIREKGGSDLYGGSAGQKYLYDFYQSGEIYLSDIPTGGNKTYEFEIIFPSEKENKWQTATTTFDILIGFQGAGGGIPPGEGSGGGGGGANGPPGWLPPGLTIQYEKEIYLDTTTATIIWNTSYPATSQVIYDTAAGKFNLNPATGGGPPNYGYAFSKEGDDFYGSGKDISHQVTLTGLLPGITYYFRCVSHGSLAIGWEHLFTMPTEEEFAGRILGSVAQVSGVAPGQQASVPEVSGAGEAIEGETDFEAGLEQEKAAEETEETENADAKEFSRGAGSLAASFLGIPEKWSGVFDWLLLILFFLLVIFLIWYFQKKKKGLR